MGQTNIITKSRRVNVFVFKYPLLPSEMDTALLRILGVHEANPQEQRALLFCTLAFLNIAGNIYAQLLSDSSLFSLDLLSDSSFRLFTPSMLSPGAMYILQPIRDAHG